MKMRSSAVLAIAVLCFSSLQASSFPLASQENAPLSPKQEIEQIDGEIKRLEEEQTRQKMIKARWTDLGQRWQFQKDMTQEAKRAFQKADDAQRQIDLNDKHLEALKARRARLAGK